MTRPGNGIELTVAASPTVASAVESYREFVAREVLAEAVTFATELPTGFAGEVGEGEPVTVRGNRI